MQASERPGLETRVSCDERRGLWAAGGLPCNLALRMQAACFLRVGGCESGVWDRSCCLREHYEICV